MMSVDEIPKNKCYAILEPHQNRHDADVEQKKKPLSPAVPDAVVGRALVRVH